MLLKKSFVDFITRNWLLIAVLLLAAFLRLFYYMGVMRGDDFTYTYYAHKLAHGELTQFSGFNGIKRPGLYGPAALFFKLFGETEFVATLFPLLASLVTIIFIYKIGSMLAGKNAGIVSAFLWSVFSLDIFMATQLDPEAPLAMAATGCVFFLLAANRQNHWINKMVFYLASSVFLVWSLYIKLSVAPLVFAIILLLIFENWQAVKRAGNKIGQFPRRILFPGITLLLLVTVILIGFILSKQPWPIALNNLELTASDTSSTWLLGRINPTQRSNVGGNWVKVKRDVYTPPAQPEALTKPTGSQRVTLFDLYTPLFIVAAAYAILNRNRSFYIPLLWFGFLFFFLEWGPYPRSLSPTKILNYTPINHWVASDNFLFISVPMILAIGIFIAHGLNKRRIAPTLLAAISLIIPTVFLLEDLQLRDLMLNSMAAIFMLTLVCIFVASFALQGKTRGRFDKSVLFVILIPLMGIAALLPSRPYHVWDYFKEQDRRDNLHAVNAYLTEHNDAPVFAGSAGLPLEIYSGFQYGYALMGERYQYPQTRMTSSRGAIARLGGYFLKEGCGDPAKLFSVWPIAEFGEADSPECFTLVKELPLGTALIQLNDAKAIAVDTPTLESINSYLTLSAQARRFSDFITALSLMATYFPGDVPLYQASGIIQTYSPLFRQNESLDLIDFYKKEKGTSWTFGPELLISLIKENGKNILITQLREKTAEPQTVSVRLELKSGTAYVLEVELKAFSPYDLLRFPDDEFPDSYPDSWNRDLEWARHKIVFVTPTWPESYREINIELARTYDRGEIWFRILKLIEVSVIEVERGGNDFLNPLAN